MGFRRRLLLAVAATAAVCAASATAAPSRQSTDATELANRFLTALVSGDGKLACSLMSENAVRKLGGPERCERSMSYYATYTYQDFTALSTLYRAYEAAHESAQKRNGKYITKQFGLRALARAIERAEPTLTVKLGRSPQAASGQLDKTIILDQRSSARRLVLYSESDDGSIWRLDAPPCGEPDFEEVAQGVPESAPPDPSSFFSISSITGLEEGKMLVRAQVKFFDFAEAGTFDVHLLLTPTTGSYLVDDLLISTIGSGESD